MTPDHDKKTKLKQMLGANQSGATAVEYGLVMALMVLALVGALGATGDKTKQRWDANADAIANAGNS